MASFVIVPSTDHASVVPVLVPVYGGQIINPLTHNVKIVSEFPICLFLNMWLVHEGKTTVIVNWVTITCVYRIRLDWKHNYDISDLDQIMDQIFQSCLKVPQIHTGRSPETFCWAKSLCIGLWCLPRVLKFMFTATKDWLVKVNDFLLTFWNYIYNWPFLLQSLVAGTNFGPCD